MSTQRIRNILTRSVKIERWAEKCNKTYSFLEDNEVEEIVDNILKNLKKNNYFISKKYARKKS